MIFEATISSTIIDKNGNDKTLKRSYILKGHESFEGVENKLFEVFGSETNFEVCAIRKSKLKEIVNDESVYSVVENYKIYFATIADRFYDEEKDEVKEIKYVVALFARDINEAHMITKQYMEQGLEDMEMKQLKETKFLDVLK